MISKAAASVFLVLATALLGGAGAQSTQGGDSGSGWGTSDTWSLRSMYSRVTGFPLVASLCTISNCQREKPLPERPGGREVARNSTSCVCVLPAGHSTPRACCAVHISYPSLSLDSPAPRAVSDLEQCVLPRFVYAPVSNGYQRVSQNKSSDSITV